MNLVKYFINQINKKIEFNFINNLLLQYKEVEVYFVGGIVRDLILSNIQQQEFKAKDIDIVIRNLSAEKLESFLHKHGKVNFVGKTFGVFKFLPYYTELEEQIDIALPRSEKALGTGRYRDFKILSEPSLPIESDLSRRDFTLNAMAIDYKRKKLIDPFGGLNDIDKRILRSVGNPYERFTEDFSRILRAIRFSCQLNFRIEKKTWLAIKSLMPKINDEKIINEKKERILPKEMIAKEFALSLFYDPLKAIKLYDESNALNELMPELLNLKGVPQPEKFHSEGDVWNHTMLCLKILKSKKFKKQFPDWEVDAELIFAILYHDIGKPKTLSMANQNNKERITFFEHNKEGEIIAGETIKKLSLTNASIRPEEVKWLIKNHMLFMNAKHTEIRNSTLVKYFFDTYTGGLSEKGKKLLMLIYCDSLATIPKGSKPNLQNFKGILKRINQLKDHTRQQISLPKPYLNGNEIMEFLNIQPGPLVGKLIELLREEQLSGKIRNRQQAIDFIKYQANMLSK